MAVEKHNLRTRARSHRATLTRADYAQAIARFADDLALAPGIPVAGYFPLRDEADPRALMSALSERRHPLALPCVTAGQPLTFRAWKMGDPMHANPRAFNIAEPLATAPAVTPGAVLVPMLAFDPDGHRLGYGGGYYDRTLAGLPHARAIGIAYAGQEVLSLPREPHDHPLDVIVTENGIRRFHHR
jgi:5-formyltetrahydrofolate cyclo-ligase